MRIRSTAVKWAGMLFAWIGWTPAQANSDSFAEYGPFQIDSDGSGQLSTGAFVVPVLTAGVLQVRFAAPASHCSAIRVHLVVDDQERAVTAAVLPGRSSDYADVGPVSAGEHVLGLRAEGIAGGCNLGRLSNWGGLIVVRTSVDSNPTDASDDSLGAVVFGYSFVNPAMGLLHQGFYVTSTGNVFGYRYTGADHPRDIGLMEGDLISEAALREQMSHHRYLMTRVSPEVMEKQLSRVPQQFMEAGTPTVSGRRIAYDAGTSTFSVYRFDAARRGYARAPATGLLLAWLHCLSMSPQKSNEVSSCQ